MVGEAEPTERADPRGPHISVTIGLPRDALSVPLIRHVVTQALRDSAVNVDCREAIELAVAEACANVVRHAASSDSYEVRVYIDAIECGITVVDTGPGFDQETLLASEDELGPLAEHGRGIALMRALVDNVKFTSLPRDGAIVHLVKRLAFEPRTPAARLLHPPPA